MNKIFFSDEEGTNGNNDDWSKTYMDNPKPRFAESLGTNLEVIYENDIMDAPLNYLLKLYPEHL